MPLAIVTPAKAGVPLPLRTNGIPAFEGMTKWLCFVWLLFAMPAAAQTFPPLTGRVVDQAHILSPSAEKLLADRSADLERRTSDQVVIATVPSLGGTDIKSYATRLGNRWGIGQKGTDNGVLVVVAPTEHKVRISVGYGLEGLLTDARAATIVQHMVPLFAKHRYEQGIERGEQEIVTVLLSDTHRPQRKQS